VTYRTVLPTVGGGARALLGRRDRPPRTLVATVARTLTGRPRLGLGLGIAAVGVGAAVVQRVVATTRRVAALEQLLPSAPAWAKFPQVLKATPQELFAPKGTGCDFETRLSTIGEEVATPTDRFYLRQHSPTPRIDEGSWRLRIEGDGVQREVELTYAELSAMPQVTLTATMECAGNGRRFFMEAYGVEAQGGQWGLGAIGTAQWSGVRLKELLERAGLVDGAREVMPIGLDEHQVSRPMPLSKALAQDTLVALGMNGEPLLPDHGFPARLVVPGWVGTSWVKWVGRLQVATRPLHTPYNTTEYVLIGPRYRSGNPALGPVITQMPVVSMIQLDRPACLPAGRQVVRGRAYAGEGTIAGVDYRIDDGPWRPAQLLSEGNTAGVWASWRFDWDATTGSHEIRVRATDALGNTQPDTVPWNHHGYLYNAVMPHPVTVGE